MCTWFGGPVAGAGWFGGNFLMMLPMLFFWGLLLWGIVTLVRKLSGTNPSNCATNNSKKALEILQERYAKGEISQEEFNKMKADIA